MPYRGEMMRCNERTNPREEQNDKSKIQKPCHRERTNKKILQADYMLSIKTHLLHHAYYIQNVCCR